MLLPATCLLLALQSGQPAKSGAVCGAPRLEVQAGNVRVFAREAWVSLAPGASPPDLSTCERLSLAWDARVRLTWQGADVELRGPLELESEVRGVRTLRVSGSGQLQLDVRSTVLRVELEATAGLDLANGIYWAQGVPSGGWRVGCDAGEPLVLRPPEGAGWSEERKLPCGSLMRIVPIPMPVSVPEVRRPAAAPWRKFSWPWGR
jgi:hypothetical protein